MNTSHCNEVVKKALSSPAEAIYVYTLQAEQPDHRFHYVDACVALRRTLRGDDFNAAALAAALAQAAKLPEFKIETASQMAGVVMVKRHIFRDDSYAFRGGYFRGKTRQEIVKSLAVLAVDCGLLCAPEFWPEQIAKAVEANQLAVPAAGFFLINVISALGNGHECWYTEDGVNKTVVL